MSGSRAKARDTASAIESFLDMMSAERGASLNTLAAYRRDLLDFAGYMTARNFTQATRNDVKTYLQQISKSGLAGSSQARRLSHLGNSFHSSMVRACVLMIRLTLSMPAPCTTLAESPFE